MKEIKVSIIIPVFNGERYLKDCMESLINQTLNDIEIICVDDGSTDRSLDILKEYQSRDDRVKLLSNPRNMGQPTSRNKGIMMAVGKYIQFVDADDYIEKQTTEELFKYSEEKNADMCYMGMDFHQEAGLDIKAVPGGISGHYPGVYEGKELIGILTENKEFFYYTWSVFYRTSFLKEHGLLYRELVCGQGGNFIPRCLCEANRVIISDKKYYHYRVHNASITHTEKAQKELLMGKIMRYVDILHYFSNDEQSHELEIFLDATYKKLLGGIECLTYDEKRELEERMPSKFARHVFHILCNKEGNYKMNFSDNEIKKIRERAHVIIYGAGYASKSIIEMLQQNEIEIVGFAVTKRIKEKISLFGHHIYEIHELQQYKSTSVVLIAANKKYNQEIRETLEALGFDDYIFLNIEI